MPGRAGKKKLDKLAGTIKKLEWLAAIIRVHLRVGTMLELDKISRIYLRALIDMVDGDGCAIIRIDGYDARVMTERGFSKTFGQMELNTDVPLIKYVVNTGEVIFTGDVHSDPAAGYIPPGCPINSLICTPVIVNESVRGIVYLDSLKKNAFNEEDMEFTELLSEEISIAFEQSLEYSHFRSILVTDGLTGCLNLRKFEADIAAEIASAKTYEEKVSLLMVDIDFFSKYNDVHGQPKGDALLEKIATKLSANIRPYEKVYRYGGEEFAILVPETDKEGAESIAGRLQKAIGQTSFEGEKKSQPKGKLTVSIGVATFPTDADSEDGLIEAANSALYQAKESGRDRVCVYSSEDQA